MVAVNVCMKFLWVIWGELLKRRVIGKYGQKMSVHKVTLQDEQANSK